MQKWLGVSVLALTLVGTPAALGAPPESRVAKQALKVRHKQAREVIKMKRKQWEDSLKGNDVTKSEKIRMKHYFEKEARKVRERQHNELQDLEDRERLAKETGSPL